MTLEERVERLETFAGNIDRITSLYANSVAEICDKYLNLLYIEVPDELHPEWLNVLGFLGDITSASTIPKNVMFNIRASHTFEAQEAPLTSRINFAREVDDPENPGTTTIQSVNLALKKLKNGNLVNLEDGDFVSGMLYSVYVSSENIAIISANDAGTTALQEVRALSNGATSTVKQLEDAITSLTQNIVTALLEATNIECSSIETDSLTVNESVNLQTGSTCSTPTNNNEIANKAYVDEKIANAIANYRTTYHLFGDGDPSLYLDSAPEGAIYYRY